MTRTRVLGALVFGSILGVAVAVYAAETQAPSETYDQYCAKCHGPDGKAQTNKGKMLKARNFTDAEWQADETDGELIKSVTEGKDDMPAFGKKLTPEQIESLVKNDVRSFAPKNKG